MVKKKMCERCGKMFHTNTNAAMYCIPCRQERFIPAYRREKRVCVCGKEFTAYRSTQRWCTSECRQDHYNKEHDIAGMIREHRARIKGEAARRTRKSGQ
jgi:hypothetical protein